jgi:hypothetical protein
MAGAAEFGDYRGHDDQQRWGGGGDHGIDAASPKGGSEDGPQGLQFAAQPGAALLAPAWPRR